MTHLAEVKREAETRRQARREKEAWEEAEILEAIRLVEEFEREEALKAELLRQEQERLAEERRQKELEERILREGERRRAVTAKFEGLREVLSTLHETQRDMVQQHHDECEQQLEHKAKAELTSLRDRHHAERDWLQTKVETQVTKREAMFKSEYAARLAEERQIEGQYATKLQTFYGVKPSGEEKIQAAMDTLKRRMDKEFMAWKKWMDGELDTYRYHIHEEQAVREELMAENERRSESNAQETRVAFTKRKTAELWWVREAFEERDRLLDGLEVDEIENGEDLDAWFADGPLEEALPLESLAATDDEVVWHDTLEFRIPEWKNSEAFISLGKH
jgi:hypothetical protein